jgi:hypothetical protein
MDNLFLNRVNSLQGIVKKEQKSIYVKSIGSTHYFFIKMRFRHAPVLLTIPKPLKQHPLLKKIIHYAL